MNYKTILACAAFLTGMVFFNGRLNAAVESDIVGYSTITIKPGFNLLGVPYGALDSDEGLTMKEIFAGSEQNLIAGDSIQFWDGSTLLNVFYAGNGVWKKGFGESTDKFKPGTGFWFNSKATEDRQMILAGRVVLGESAQTITAEANMYKLIASPVPVAYKLSDIQFSDNLPTGASIQYWNDPDILNIFYAGNGVWKQGFTVVDREFQPGEGFWFLTRDVDVTITFPVAGENE